MQLMGYRRGKGRFGIRNYLLVIPASICASETAVRIAAQFPGAVAIPHQHGCCQVGEDFKQTVRTLIGFGRNPNVGAALVVGLGCEGIDAHHIAAEIAAWNKPAEAIIIQECGGTLGAVNAGATAMARLSAEVLSQPREAFDVGELVLALECGGSDPTSGLAANPAVGFASDLLIDAGGSSILSETTEVIGAEHLLAQRFEAGEKRERFLRMVRDMEQRALAIGEDLRGTQPTPGNIAGGLTTIEEKSLGCMHKAGKTHPFVDALEYGQPLPENHSGLYFMDSPGEDIDSITGMVAGGAQIVVFTTGRGTPTGCPIAPVIKVTGNSGTFARMCDNIDIDAGRIITEGLSIEEVGREIYDAILAAANGAPTKAELLGHREFGIYRIGPTF